MLVCHVSDKQRRLTITTDLAESGAALDLIQPGLSFAALVDDPASVREMLDAFFGDVMLEEAHAISEASAGLIYQTLIDEPTHADEALSAFVSVPLGAAVAEAATAADLADGSVLAVATRSAMLPSAFVNSSGTPRQANADGTMVNL